MSLPHHSIRARPPRGDAAAATLRDDPDLLSRYAEDAAHFPGGHAAAVAAPRTEADVAQVLRHARSVLAVGAQSSLTGGATPRGDVVLTTSRMNQVLDIGDDT